MGFQAEKTYALFSCPANTYLVPWIGVAKKLVLVHTKAKLLYPMIHCFFGGGALYYLTTNYMYLLLFFPINFSTAPCENQVSKPGFSVIWILGKVSPLAIFHLQFSRKLPKSNGLAGKISPFFYKYFTKS